MTQYKSIREWIAEGIEPIGYVDKEGDVLVSIELDAVATRCTLQSDPEKHTATSTVGLDYTVARPAPQAPKRLSDEELVGSLENACVFSVDRSWDDRHEERRIYRSQILDRMKAKGPTRGEVNKWLGELWELYDVRTDRWRDYVQKTRDFLSMFPEADQ